MQLVRQVQTQGLLVALVICVALLPGLWLLVLDMNTTTRLSGEVERLMENDARLFAEGLRRYTEQVLTEADLIRPMTGHAQVLRTATVQQEVLPEAFRRLTASLQAERGADAFPGGIVAMEVRTPDTTLVLSEIDPTLLAGHEAAVDALTQAFEMSGLFPGWSVHVACFNEVKANRWRRYMASIIPLLILVLGVGFMTRVALREMEMSRIKSTFVSNVSHELKMPLAKIQFFNELLQQLPVEEAEKHRRYHGAIEQECERLALLVDNLLDFNLIERGQMHYTFVDTSLREIAEDVVETFNTLYGGRGYQVTLTMDDALPTIKADADALRQALINLMDNAVKYSDPHTVQVSARRATIDGKPAVALCVADEGLGIPTDKQALIFEEFYRIDSGLAQRVSGSGLGLALVRHIARAHGGDIRVESTPGQGAAFTLLIPFKTKQNDGTSRKE